MRALSLLLVGIVAILLLLEGALRLLPVPDGLFAADPVADWPVHRMVPNSRVVQSFGWDLQFPYVAHVNAQGYPSSFDYLPGAPVGVVIGDSYVEGLSEPESERFVAYLAKDLRLPEKGVYNFGSSGASLPHYLGVARLIGARYRPQWATILVTDRDFVEGFAPPAGYYGWGTGGDLVALNPERRRGRLAKIARSLALNRYLRGSLKFSPAILFSSGLSGPATPGRCRPPALGGGDRRLLESWLAAVPQALHLPASRIVLVFDSNRASLYLPAAKRPAACPDRDDLARAWLGQAAASAGYGVVETAPLFARAWARQHVPLDHAPLDAHWTPYTNQLVAGAVAPLIRASATP